MRYYRQRGFLPTILFGVGISIHLIFIGGTLPYLFGALFSMFSGTFTVFTFLSLLELVFGMIGLVWSIPLIIGTFLVSAFPKIRITNEGIEICTYLIFRSRFKWNEIAGVVKLPKGYKAITISRPGFPLINGLYSSKIYGDIVKSNLPVILISPRLENINLLLQEIDIHRKDPSNITTN